jgi:alpha/beta superfamily hydrolase
MASQASLVTERLSITTADGVTLEARIDSAPSPSRFTVFCHPHPLHGGSMNAPLMIGVSRQLAERGHMVLRFNFRGTGSSSGRHEYGEGEQLDIDAAMELAEPGLPTSIAGWSFGASTALRWIAKHDSTIPYVGIAPPPEALPGELPGGPKRFVVGTRDQVIDAEALRAYAADQSIDIVITPGDHFFHGRGKKIGDLVGQGLEA